MTSYLPPPPPQALVEHAAITDSRAQCTHADWTYLGAAAGSLALATTLDITAFEPSSSFAMRATGPAVVGLAWGWLVSAAFWARPLCHEGYLGSSEGAGVEAALPELTWLGPVLAVVTAPIAVAIAEGPPPEAWPFSERWQRLSGAAAAGLLGSFAHELWIPRPLRGLRALEGARLAVDATGVGIALRF